MYVFYYIFSKIKGLIEKFNNYQKYLLNILEKAYKIKQKRIEIHNLSRECKNKFFTIEETINSNYNFTKILSFYCQICNKPNIEDNFITKLNELLVKIKIANEEYLKLLNAIKVCEFFEQIFKENSERSSEENILFITNNIKNSYEKYETMRSNLELEFEHFDNYLSYKIIENVDELIKENKEYFIQNDVLDEIGHIKKFN